MYQWVKVDSRGAGYGMVSWSASVPLAPIGFAVGALTGAVFWLIINL